MAQCAAHQARFIGSGSRNWSIVAQVTTLRLPPPLLQLSATPDATFGSSRGLPLLLLLPLPLLPLSPLPLSLLSPLALQSPPLPSLHTQLAYSARHRDT